MGYSPWRFEELDTTKLLTLLLLLSMHSRCVSYGLEEDPAMLSNLQPRLLLEMMPSISETFTRKLLSEDSQSSLNSLLT